MADLIITYQGNDIVELSDSGSKTLKTGGTYCENDIEVEYVKPSGGSTITKDVITLTSDVNDSTQGIYYSPANYVDRNYDGVQICYITNNEATSNIGQYILIDRLTNNSIINSSGMYGVKNSVTVASSGILFNMTAGTVITRYKIPPSMFL